MNGTEDFMIIACDGLWDTVTLDEAAKSVFETLKDNKGKSVNFFERNLDVIML